MDIVPILSTIILISTLITLIVAIASYMTFRIKEKKKQAAMAEFSEVFSADLAELQDSSPVESMAPTTSAPLVIVTPPAAAPAPSTTVVVSPPVVVTAPQQATPVENSFPQPQQQPQQQSQPQQQQQIPYNSGSAGSPLQYPQHQQAGNMPPPYQDPYGMPFPGYAPQPRAPQYSGAQAAFMKGFGGDQPPMQDENRQQQQQGSDYRQQPQGGEYGQQPGMRRFTPPEQKPRQQQPQPHSDDSPAWK